MRTVQTVPFTGTKEQEVALKEQIAALKGEEGCLLPIMQKAQGIYGYLPIEVMQMISDGTGYPLSKIYGIATFYSRFNLSPKGKYQVMVCLGTACYVKGSQRIVDQFADILGIQPGQTTKDGLFTLDALRCIGACAAAPAVVINGKIHARVEPNQVSGIIAEYREEAGHV